MPRTNQYLLNRFIIDKRRLSEEDWKKFLGELRDAPENVVIRIKPLLPDAYLHVVMETGEAAIIPSYDVLALNVALDLRDHFAADIANLVK